MYFRCVKCQSDSKELNNGCCPICGWDEVYQVDHCKNCDTCYDNDGDDNNPVYYGYCAECLRGFIKDDPDTALEYINKDGQTQIDFYIGHYFNTSADLTEENTSYELLELCKKQFNRMYKTGCEIFHKECIDSIYDFVDYELDNFAEWLERREDATNKRNQQIYRI